MARQVNDSEMPRVAGGAIYSWHEWSDGSTWQLVRGEDYTVTDLRMQKSAHGYACRNGLRAQTAVNEEGVVLRFIKPSPPTKKLKKIRPKK